MAHPRDVLETESRNWGDRYVTFASLRRILEPIYELLETLMATEQELETAQAAEATELSTVTADLATLSTDTTNAIKALQEKVEQGGLVTAAELEAAVTNSKNVTTGLTALDTSIKTDDAEVNPPAPAPTPAPTTEPTPAS